MVFFIIWVVALAFILPDSWGWVNYLLGPILAIPLAYLTGLTIGSLFAKFDKK
ncbi:MAG: hypothetical protein WCG99_01250 [Candidatus Berkelbacteria bacterium]